MAVLAPEFSFNPLKTLRLALALGPDQSTVETICRCIWEEGLLPEDEQGWQGIVEALGVDDADARIAESDIKEKLQENGNSRDSIPIKKRAKSSQGIR